jgi:large subunit ribosomal protein L20
MTHFSYKKIFKLAKGYYGKGKNCIKTAAPRVDRALRHAYIERKLKKRDMRKNWIISINAAVREHNMPYSRFIYGLSHSNLQLDRKILSDLSENEPYSFKAIIDELKLQTGLGVEDRLRNLNSFQAGISDGVISPPGGTKPSLDVVNESLLEKDLKWREDFIPKYTKPVKPSPQNIQKMKDNGLWESDWDDDDFWAK